MSKIDFVKSGKLKYIILSVIAVLLIAAILLAALIVDKKQSSDGGGHINGVIEYDGKEYALRGGVESFLILGIVKTDENIKFIKKYPQFKPSTGGLFAVDSI